MANLQATPSWSNVVQLEVDTLALGGQGGPMNQQAQQLLNRTEYLNQLIQALNQTVAGISNSITIVDGLNSTNPNYVLSANQGNVLYTLIGAVQMALAGKLNTADYNQHYKGLHVTVENLQAAHPTASPGDYAQVDTGNGFDLLNYYWDVEGGWITNNTLSSGAVDTDGLPEGNTNLYFLAQRAIDAAVTVMARFDQAQTLSLVQKLQHHANVGTYDVYNNTVPTYIDNYVLQTTDNVPNAFVRMTTANPGTVSIEALLTNCITIRQAGDGVITLVDGTGVTSYGNKVFAGKGDSKVIVPLGNGEYDIYGGL